MVNHWLFSILLVSTSLLANPVIENAKFCAIKDLSVTCEKGDTINLDVIRNYDQRGDIFLKINTTNQIGNTIELSIDGNRPQILKIETTISNLKGVFIPRNVILKLRDAFSVSFKINMLNRDPIAGRLTQSHFEWLKRFGQICS